MDQRLCVRYEDEAILVVDKPAGLHTAPNRLPPGPDTLLAMVLASFPEVSQVPGLKPSEHGLLQRLDRDTSGLVVIARTPQAFDGLRPQFASGLVRKEYRAVCAVGDTAQQSLTIASRFAPAGPGRRTVRVVLQEVPREATARIYTTEASVIRRKGGFALVSVIIFSGFRHQIRAHLSHAGWPIFGDPLYGVPVPPGSAQRLYLHATALSLTHPVTGKQLQVVSPLPGEFSAFFGMVPNT